MRLTLLAPWLLFACAAPQVPEPRGPEARLDAVPLPQPPRTQRPTAELELELGPARAAGYREAPDSRGAARAVDPSAATAAESRSSALTFALIEEGRGPSTPLRVALPESTEARDASPEEQAEGAARLELAVTAEVPGTGAAAATADEPDLSLLDGHLTGGYPVMRDGERLRASLVGGVRYVLIDPEHEAGTEVGGELELVGPFVGLRLQF